LVHQEEGVAVFLDAGLQAIGGGYGPVAAASLAVHEKDSLTSLCSEDEAGFDDIWKNKNGDCFRFTFGGRRILRHELLHSATRVAGQIVGRCRRVLSNVTAASISPAAYFHFNVIIIYVFVSLGHLLVPGGKQVA
jgi:hypothetical protein